MEASTLAIEHWLHYLSAVELGIGILIGGMVAVLLAQVTRILVYLQRIEKQLKKK